MALAISSPSVQYYGDRVVSPSDETLNRCLVYRLVHINYAIELDAPGDIRFTGITLICNCICVLPLKANMV